MMGQFGNVGICGMGIAVVAIDNVKNGRDPFPALLAGGLLTAGIVGVGEIEPDMARALAVLFLLSNLLLKSSSTLDVVSGITGKVPRGPSSGTANSQHTDGQMAGRNSTANSAHAN